MAERVLTRVDGLIGRITLNRPAALHALDLVMCERITDALLAWRDDPAIAAVMLDHLPDTRGFCAGGDAVAVRRSVLEDDGAEARAMFLAEYGLNHLLFTYGKPVITFMDGVTMGGGAGLALPATLRVATENTLFAMPECTLGLFPDIGAGYFLPRLPGETGKFMALTAARLDGAECLWAGIATHYLDSEDLDEAKEMIAREPAAADEILRDLASPLPTARLAGNAEKIDRLFAADTLEGILAALDADGSDWAAKERAAIMAGSPTSAKASLRLFAESAGVADFAAEMAKEYALAIRMSARPDYAEGVRARLVDKDNKPQWQPATAEGVGDDVLDALFAQLPPGEAWTPIA